MSDGASVYKEFDMEKPIEDITSARITELKAMVEIRLDEIEGMVEERLVALEQKMPDATAIIGSLTQLGEAFNQLHQQVMFLSQQRAVAEQQLERHTRATALDLAIKAAPTAPGENMTALADAFVVWLKGGTN